MLPPEQYPGKINIHAQKGINSMKIQSRQQKPNPLKATETDPETLEMAENRAQNGFLEAQNPPERRFYSFLLDGLAPVQYGWYDG